MNKKNLKKIKSYYLSYNYYNDRKEMSDEEIEGDSSKYLSCKIEFLNKNY